MEKKKKNKPNVYLLKYVTFKVVMRNYIYNTHIFIIKKIRYRIKS